LAIIYIFAFTGVHLKYASVSQQLIAPILSGTGHSDGGNKLSVQVFDSNFLFLVCRLGRICVGAQEKWRVSR
jgi:hypothetical protein